MKSPSKKRIMIIGGCGFIGSNLVKYLLDRSPFEIIVYDNLTTGSKENMEKAVSDSQQKGTVNFIKGDILEKKHLDEVSKRCNAIIHLAAHTRVVESLENPEENFTINMVGIFDALEAARKNNIEHFVFASSNAAVGEQKMPINENQIPAPLSPYGATKLGGEALCSAWYHSYGTKTIALRFSNAYGIYSKHKTSVVTKFIKRALKGLALEIYGDGNQTRDFIYAEDICQAIWLAFTGATINEEHWGTCFQIATGIETKIINLAHKIQQEFEKRNLKFPDIVFKSARKGEIVRNYSDISKAKKILGFSPKISIDEGLEQIFCEI